MLKSVKICIKCNEVVSITKMLSDVDIEKLINKEIVVHPYNEVPAGMR